MICWEGAGVEGGGSVSSADLYLKETHGGTVHWVSGLVAQNWKIWENVEKLFNRVSAWLVNSVYVGLILKIPVDLVTLRPTPFNFACVRDSSCLRVSVS